MRQTKSYYINVNGACERLREILKAYSTIENNYEIYAGGHHLIKEVKNLDAATPTGDPWAFHIVITSEGCMGCEDFAMLMEHASEIGGENLAIVDVVYREGDYIVTFNRE